MCVWKYLWLCVEQGIGPFLLKVCCIIQDAKKYLHIIFTICIFHGAKKVFVFSGGHYKLASGPYNCMPTAQLRIHIRRTKTTFILHVTHFPHFLFFCPSSLERVHKMQTRELPFWCKESFIDKCSFRFHYWFQHPSPPPLSISLHCFQPFQTANISPSANFFQIDFFCWGE